MRAEQALGEQQAQMLQVALAPAAVALHLLEQRRRHLLVAAAAGRRRATASSRRAPSAPPRRSRGSGSRRRAAACRAAAAGAQCCHERRDADDRVVAPVLAVAELPEVQAGGEHRPVDAAGELLHAREQRAPVDRRSARSGSCRRRGAAPSVAPARTSVVARHDAVGVEHDHVAVLAAPAPAEVGDVAALALQAHAAAAVEDACRSR